MDARVPATKTDDPSTGPATPAPAAPAAASVAPPPVAAASTQQSSGFVVQVDDASDEKFGRDVRRKLKLEAWVTSGCGKQKEKVRIIDTFWRQIWPALEQLGWSKVDGTGDRVGAMSFLPPGVDLSIGKKGVHYYDRIRGVIDRVLERRNDAEAALADTYERDIVVGDNVVSPATAAAATSSNKKPRITIVTTKSNNNNNSLATTAGRDDGANSMAEPQTYATTTKNPTAGAAGGGGGADVYDVSWKLEGSFAKRESSVGENYQVSVIPAAGTYREGDSDTYCELVWDPKKAIEKGVCVVDDGANSGDKKKDDVDNNDETTPTLNDIAKNADLISQLPHNKKERGLLLLAERDYEGEGFVDVVGSTVVPSDGSDWTPEQRQIFDAEIFRTRKNFNTVAKTLHTNMKTCLAYYLGTYKTSDSYRLLKTICAEERLLKHAATEFDKDACAVCGDGGNLLICDGCEGEYHMSCMAPVLTAIPDGHWECDQCVNTKLLATRDFLLRNSPGAFVRRTSADEDDQDTTPTATGRRKRSIDETGSGGGVDGSAASGTVSTPYSPVSVSKSLVMAYKPTDEALEAVRVMAKGIAVALSKNPESIKPPNDNNDNPDMGSTAPPATSAAGSGVTATKPNPPALNLAAAASSSSQPSSLGLSTSTGLSMMSTAPFSPPTADKPEDPYAPMDTSQ